MLVPGFGAVIILMCLFTGRLPELRILAEDEVLHKTVINQGKYFLLFVSCLPDTAIPIA
jgi:hypothetical protein